MSVNDIRYGLRTLALSPGFTAVAVISLGVGICAATSFFSEMNALILRDVPAVSEPDGLVTLESPVCYPAYRRYRERADLFSSTTAYVAPVPFGVSFSGRTERVWGHLVTPSYFATLGVRPAIGRFFDDRDTAPAVVFSQRFWQNHLGADPAILGKTVRINGRTCTVAAIGPENFLGASPMMFVADLWMSVEAAQRIAPEVSDNALERPNLAIFQFVARLKPAVTAAHAEAALDTIARQIDKDFGGDTTEKGRRVRLKAGGKLVPTRKQDLPLVIALPLVVLGLILLIACSNVANMMLARAANRRREIAVRLALGARRATLIRQLLTESMLVAAGAGLLGFVLTLWLMRFASQIKLPHAMPIRFEVAPDARVLLFAFALTAFTGLAFGLAPALQATGADVTPALKNDGVLRKYGRFSLRNLLVLYQVAASLTLLFVTGAVVLGFRATTGIDVGFNPQNLYMLSLDPVRDGYSGPQAAALFEKLVDRLKHHPAISSAAITDTVPMAGTGRVTFSTAASQPAAPRALHTVRKYVVGRDYFQTMGIPILLGRSFRKQHETDDAPAVIVSEALARQAWNAADPLGRRVEIGDGIATQFDMFAGSFLDYRSARHAAFYTVIGVARDIKMESALERAQPAVYFPLRPADYARPTFRGITLLLRAAPGVDALGAVRAELSRLDGRLAPFHARGMPEQIDELMFPVRQGIWSYGVMGLFGLILAATGITGITAYSVTRRRREIGIRFALGAPSSHILRLVMSEGAALVAIGTIAGSTLSWAVLRLLSASIEPVARIVSAGGTLALIIGAPLLLAALALAACYLPAHKSLRIDPAVALRHE